MIGYNITQRMEKGQPMLIAEKE